jgi:hypothetical protein
MFTKMNKTEWSKTKAGTNTLRIDILKNIIRKGLPVSSFDGKDIFINNSRDNHDAIDAFLDSKDETFTVKAMNGSDVNSLSIGKSAVFGGKGQGAGATGKTAEGECLQCVYLCAMLAIGTRHPFARYTPELLKQYHADIDVDLPFEKYMTAAPAWHHSAYVSAIELINKGYVNKTHTLHRGSKAMQAIYDAQKKAYANEGKRPIQGDKWNPGDIWAIKKGFNPRTLNTSSLIALNGEIKGMFIQREMVGISLKQIEKLTDKPKISEYNLDATKLDSHEFTRATLITSNRKGAQMWSSKGGYFFFDRTRYGDVRASNQFATVGFELAGQGARGGRAGNADLVKWCALYFKKVIPTNAQLKATAKAMVGGKKENLNKDMFKLCKIIHPDLDYDEWVVELSSAAAHQIHANLGAAHILAAVVGGNRIAQRLFTSTLVNKAASKGNESSVYMKIEKK